MNVINTTNVIKTQNTMFGKAKTVDKSVQKALQALDDVLLVKKFKTAPDMAKEDQMREMTLKMKKWLRNLPKRIERRVVNSFFDPNAEEIFPKKDNCHDLK